MVAIVQAGDATEMIPLLNESATVPGLYNRGTNNIDDFRRYFLGALVSKSGNQGFAWKSGILCPSGFFAGQSFDGEVHEAAGGPAQVVDVWQFRAIVVRAGIGPYLVAQDGHKLSIPAPAADATNPRKDLFCVMPYDKGKNVSDAQHGPKYIWVTGDPAASPAVPALPAAVSDALILSVVTRAANDNTIAAADFSDQRKGVSLHGTPWTMLPGNLLSDAGQVHGEIRRRRFSSSITAVTSLTEIHERWDHVDSKWHSLQNVPMVSPAQSFSSTIANGVTTTLATLSIPDMGFPYKLLASGGYEYTTADGGALVGCQLTANSSVINAGTVARGVAKFADGAGGSKWCGAVPDDRLNTTIQPGSACTVRMLATNYSAASGISIVSGAQFAAKVSIEPV